MDNEYFMLPKYIQKRSRCRAFLHCTADNHDVRGIDLSVISDNEIRSVLRQSGLDQDVRHISGLHKQIIHIGTKDECDPRVLYESLRVVGEVAAQMGRTHHYVGHPSFHLHHERQAIRDILKRFNVCLYPNALCVESLLFMESGLVFAGDYSTLSITALRLGHRYFLINEKLKHLLPDRPAQEEFLSESPWAKQLMT